MYKKGLVYAVRVLIALIAVGFYSCKSIYTNGYKKPFLVDKKASHNTKLLHKKLFFIAKNGIAIGHQDATAYGIGWKCSDSPGMLKCDVNDIIGDFPAVYGFDIARIEHLSEMNIDHVPFDTMKELIVAAHKSGGVVTISWHVDNPVTGGGSWDQTPAVKQLLAGGEVGKKYELWVERVAGFLSTIRYGGKPVPIVFRPFHEMNGSWFWWGGQNCEASDYVELWRRTVSLLKNKYKLHNLLYAYSPNKLNTGDDYMKYYPGDEYVDILGIDIYDFNNAAEYTTSISNDLTVVKQIAREKDKLYAFTETGLEKLQTPGWFTQVLYPAIEGSGIAWILFWRNARKSHHYMPYKGHLLEDDFKAFAKLPRILFLSDINNLTH